MDSATGPETTSITRTSDRQEDAKEGDQQHHRAQLPERAPLVDLVDTVHRSAEGADVAGCDHSAPARPATNASPAACEVAMPSRTGRMTFSMVSAVDERTHVVEDRPDGLVGLSDEAEGPSQREQRGEDRQHGVVGQRRGLVGALVVAELAQGLARDVLPRARVELGRPRPASRGRPGRASRRRGRGPEPWSRSWVQPVLKVGGQTTTRSAHSAGRPVGGRSGGVLRLSEGRRSRPSAGTPATPCDLRPEGGPQRSDVHFRPVAKAGTLSRRAPAPGPGLQEHSYVSGHLLHYTLGGGNSDDRMVGP